MVTATVKMGMRSARRERRREIRSIAFDVVQLARLDAVAAREGTNRSRIVREAVDDALVRYERRLAGSREAAR